jgi:hypothetical protein
MIPSAGRIGRHVLLLPILLAALTACFNHANDNAHRSHPRRLLQPMSDRVSPNHGTLTNWQRFAASLLVIFGGTVADEDTAAYAAHLAYAGTANAGRERGTAILFTGAGFTYYRLGSDEGYGDPDFHFGSIKAGGIVGYWHSHGDVRPLGEIASMAAHPYAVRMLDKDIYTSFTEDGRAENLWVEYRTSTGIEGQLIKGHYYWQADDIDCTLCEHFNVP